MWEKASNAEELSGQYECDVLQQAADDGALFDQDPSSPALVFVPPSGVNTVQPIVSGEAQMPMAAIPSDIHGRWPRI